MKVFVYTLVLLFMAKMIMSIDEALMSAEAPFRHLDCPLLDDAQHPVQLAHPTNCNKYYSCHKGIAHPLNCPEKLHWSILTYRCDYPAVAKCSANTAQQNPTSTDTPIDLPITLNPSNGINEPHLPEAVLYRNYPGDCQRFYQCEVMRCPQHLHWNDKLQRCDFPHMAACEYASAVPPVVPVSTFQPSTFLPIIPTTEFIPTAATPPSTTPVTITSTINGGNDTSTNAEDSQLLNQLCSANIQHSLYLHYPDDCHKFIQCNGIAFVHTCPANLFWNAELLTCDRYCK